MQGQIHICFISVGNRVHLSFVSVDLRTRVARYPVQDKGGEAPLEEDGAQACIICGMLGCCIPGTFFPGTFFSKDLLLLTNFAEMSQFTHFVAFW